MKRLKSRLAWLSANIDWLRDAYSHHITDALDWIGLYLLPVVKWPVSIAVLVYFMFFRK